LNYPQLHINLYIQGREEGRYNVQFPYTRNTTYLERREGKIPLLPWKGIHKYHK
jgi:hypothetical protein